MIIIYEKSIKDNQDFLDNVFDTIFWSIFSHHADYKNYSRVVFGDVYYDTKYSVDGSQTILQFVCDSQYLKFVAEYRSVKKDGDGFIKRFSVVSSSQEFADYIETMCSLLQ